MHENNNLKVYPNFSVLMSLYYKENAAYLKQCLESLENQTIKANEWVIVKDGPLTNELEKVLENYEKKYPNLIKYVIFEENQGLGLALRSGILACSYEIIARMDTDDVCIPERFEIQLKEFVNNPNLDICGSHIKEFDVNPEKWHSVRKVPLINEDIIRYQKRRSAYNHVTVMFRKSAVLRAGNYENAPLMEDDMLWTRMIIAGCIGKNIDDYLVIVRTGAKMIERRGGWSYFKNYKASRKKVYQLGLASYWDYIYTLMIQLVVALLPVNIRKVIFENLLRRKK